MVYEKNIELKEKQEKLIAEIRKIIGNKKLSFSSDYFEQCKKDSLKIKYDTPYIGEGKRPYYAITKTYVYCPCRVVFSNNNENTEYGAHILRYALGGYQTATERIRLEDLFVKDLEKIYNDIKFYLWWEKEVRYKTLRTKMIECEKYVKMFEKMSDRN